jgi:hypothetical protein
MNEIPTSHYSEDRFKRCQIEAINYAKWLRGVETRHDPGDEFIEEWIKKFSKEFRENWDNSVCKDCVESCGHECRSFCYKYIKY